MFLTLLHHQICKVKAIAIMLMFRMGKRERGERDVFADRKEEGKS
jgi:hypothetical protein